MAGHFVVNGRGAPVVSNDPQVNWENDAIQFARLLAEMKAAGYFGRDSRRLERALCDSMDINSGQFAELIDRAEDVWNSVQDDLPDRRG